MSDLVDHYLACWNADDADDRRRLVATLFTPDVRYVDPLADAHGADALLATMEAVRAQFPGFVFTTVDDGDAHHDVARFRWGLGPDGAEPVIVGADVVRLDASGRVASVSGFLDRVPA